MVVSNKEKGRRKREKVTPTTIDATREISPEEPKRPRVQAQRKFAQGQGTSSAYLTYTTPIVPPKERTTPNEGPVTELLPNLRPNTEDFLTFLCFRNSSVLPPNLDFFNNAANNHQATPVAGTSATSTVTSATNAEQSEKSEEHSNGSEEKAKACTSTNKEDEKSKSDESSNKEKPTYMPFAVRKRAEQHPDNEALRKKLAEKRKAQMKASAKGSKQVNNKPAATRTRANSKVINYDEPSNSKVEEVGRLKEVDNESEKETPMKKKPCLKVETPPVVTQKLEKTTPKNKETPVKTKETPVKTKETPVKTKDILVKTKEIPVKNTENKITPAKNVDKTKANSENKAILRVETVDGESSVNKSTTKPLEIITKKEPEIHQEEKKPEVNEKNKRRRTRLTALKSPTPPPQPLPAIFIPEKPVVVEKLMEEKPKELPLVEIKKNQVNIKRMASVDFSSEDDEPLSKAIVMKKVVSVQSRKTRKSAPVQKQEVSPEKKLKRSQSVDRKSDAGSKKANAKTKCKVEPEVIPTNNVDPEVKPTNNIDPGIKPTNNVEPEIKPINNVEPEVKPVNNSEPEVKAINNVEPEEKPKIDIVALVVKEPEMKIEKIEPKPDEQPPVKMPIKRGRKKKGVDSFGKKEETVKEEPHHEPDVRTSRPSRKTKEAATLYMELMGRRLNTYDKNDDDASSMDSLEIPNVKKLEQMEIEMKLNVNKKEENKLKSLNEPKKVQVVAKKKEKEDNNKDILNKALEKSFSDSDEEPLATKLVKRKKGRPKKSTSPVKDLPKNDEKPLEQNKTELEETPEEPKEIVVTENIREEPKIVEMLTPTKTMPPPERFSTPKSAPLLVLQTSNASSGQDALNKTFGSDEVSSTAVNKSPEKPMMQMYLNQSQSSPKINRPVALPFSRTPPQKLMHHATEMMTPEKPHIVEIPFNRNLKTDMVADDKIFDDFEEMSPPPPPLPKTNSLLGNLLPSKEESEKIFGIASVSLAQSSGPLDTKCTLGKCGSVHKPPLGPPVLTESLLGGHLSPRDRRKTKVNMTHDQIQKWLDETSWSAVPDDLDDEFRDIIPLTVDLESKQEKPSTSNLTDSDMKIDLKEPVRKEVEKASTPTGSGRGPQLKAKPVVMKPEKVEIVTQNAPETPPPKKEEKPVQKKEEKPSPKKEEKPLPKKEEKISPKKEEEKPAAKKEEKISPVKIEEVKEEVKEVTPKKETRKSKAEPKKASPAVDKKPPIYNPRRAPVYKPDPKPKGDHKNASNKFGAFSPENEHSVYSFDKEDDFIPAATPFRRHSNRFDSEGSASKEKEKSKDESSPGKKEETFQLPQTLTTPTKSNTPQEVQSPHEENSKSEIITVPAAKSTATKINEIKEKKEKKSEAENDSDSEGQHTFYIPLQGPSTSGNNKSDQLIQGVAVKLGTEGPEGPNQRVIMHAKLVTKAQMGTNTTPISESMANVQDLVKSIMAGGSATTSKSVPAGNLQSRHKQNEQPSTSEAPPSEPTPSITRMNSNSSISSQKSKSTKAKIKTECQIQPDNNTAFPRRDDPAQMVEAPIFRPTEKEFQDPIEYIERITPVAARFGICRIIPPDSFKPECRISDDMRFMAYNQYVHKMLHRWGPSAKEYAAIKKYLATQSIALQQPPLIGGMEVDLPRLYHTVQELGGLKETIERKKWARVAEDMCIPKAAHDRVSKLDDIYCKYLLPYDTLSPAERQKLFDEVEADWAKREAKARRNADKCVASENRSSEDSEEDDDDEEDEEDENTMECIVKGRTMPLNQFFRIARNTMSLWFKGTEATVSEIESEYWRHVAVRDSHVCVHSGSIDSSASGCGFPSPKVKGPICAKHPWNLKVLTNNSSSILRSLGPVMGITIPTLHVGMLFSACCWYRDPHGLSWIEYLHTGANKLWYAVPDDQNGNFRNALTSLVPTHVQNKKIWLPCDNVMVPPHMLTDRNVSLCRTEQQPGQFVVIFPRAYTSNLCTGYTVSESVYFATNSWLQTANDDFKDIEESCEPTMFSVEQLLFGIASDQRSNHDTLVSTLPMIEDIYRKETHERQNLEKLQVVKSEKLPESERKNSSLEDFECDLCRANLYVSLVKVKEPSESTTSDDDQEEDDERMYCLKHAIKYLNENRINAKFCKLVYTFSLEDIESLIKKLQERINGKKTNKRTGALSQSSSSYQSGSKFAGMTTMLK